MKQKILILCTGNSCRSQMAEGILQTLDNELVVYSAGTQPEEKVNPNAIKVMKEMGIDISKNFPKNVDRFINETFDYVITVCDNARETCPVFSGKVKHSLHIGFEDPAKAKGDTETLLSVYRKVRDEIKFEFEKFYKSINKLEVMKEKKNTTGKALAFSLAVWLGYIIFVLIILLVFFRI